MYSLTIETTTHVCRRVQHSSNLCCLWPCFLSYVLIDNRNYQTCVEESNTPVTSVACDLVFSHMYSLTIETTTHVCRRVQHSSNLCCLWPCFLSYVLIDNRNYQTCVEESNTPVTSVACDLVFSHMYSLTIETTTHVCRRVQHSSNLCCLWPCFLSYVLINNRNYHTCV